VPRIDLEPIEAMRFAQGQAVAGTTVPDATYRVYAADVFVGIALAIDGALRPRRVTAAVASGSVAEGTRVPIGSGLV
jgi:hypothetical protein